MYTLVNRSAIPNLMVLKCSFIIILLFIINDINTLQLQVIFAYSKLIVPPPGWWQLFTSLYCYLLKYVIGI